MVFRKEIITEPSRFRSTMLLQPMAAKETQIRFKMQKDGEPVWDQTTIDRLWVRTQREAMIEAEPPATSLPVEHGRVLRFRSPSSLRRTRISLKQ